MADYVRGAVETAVRIHEEDLPGDILIFLTGAQISVSLHLFCGASLQLEWCSGSVCATDRLQKRVGVVNYRHHVVRCGQGCAIKSECSSRLGAEHEPPQSCSS